MARNPSQFDDCVTDVKRSLAKYGRSGNAYAICTSAGTRRNRRRKNAGFDELLDSVVKLSPTGSALTAIERQREKLERKLSRETKNPRHKTHARSNKRRAGRKGGRRVKANSTIWQKGTIYTKRKPPLKRKVRPLLANGKKRKNGKRNPIPAAQQRYESFHGRPSEELIEVTTPIHEHSVVAGIGELVKLTVISRDGRKVTIKNFGVNAQGQPCILSMNEAATQLFIDGGDQAVDVADFGIDTPYHETETLGQVKDVYYFTTKDHLGNEGGTATYHHKFGGIRKVNRNGRWVRARSPLPDLIYDVRNRLLHFSGGGYTLPDEGIAN